jgi:aryl-phospho-beta-D-glucosidase BglC (GH1 family)
MKIMKKAAVPLILSFLLCGLSTLSSAQTGTWYKTDGTQIIGPDNMPIVFHGVNSSGMEWGAGYPWKVKCRTPKYGCWGSIPGNDEYANLARWGFNLVRLPIAWANIEPTAPISPSTHEYNQQYLSALDDIIAKFGEKHIPVILSMHQWAWSPAIKAQYGAHKGSHGLGMPVWLYSATPNISQDDAQRAFFMENTEILPGYKVQDAYIDAWKTVVERYKNNPTVIGVDLFNEPPGQPSYDLASFYEKVGLAINGINPKLLLVFEDGVNQGSKLKRKPGIPNAVYSFHMYPSSWLTDRKSVV